MAETSSSDHGRNRFLCVLFFFYFLSTHFQMLPNKHGYLTALQGGRSWLHQTAGMDSAFFVAIAVKMGCSSVPSHTLILRYEYPVVLTTLNLKIPFQLNALFIFSMHFRPDHSCFVAYATEDTNGPACNVTSSSPDSKHVGPGKRSLSHVCHRTWVRR